MRLFIFFSWILIYFIAYWHGFKRGESAKPSKPSSVTLTFDGEEGTGMKEGFVGQEIDYKVVAIKDQKGNAAKIDGKPAPIFDAVLADVKPADDGMSGVLMLKSEGSFPFAIEVDADLGDGFESVRSVEEVIVISPLKAKSVEVALGEAHDHVEPVPVPEPVPEPIPAPVRAGASKPK